jgi:hypothetical protein
MGRTFKLSDIHLILLSTAAERDNGALLPAAASIADKQEQVTKGLGQLLKHRLVEEVAAGLKDPAWREAGDDRFGLAITAAGRAAIGIEEEGGDKGALPSTEGNVPAAPPSPRPASKSASVVALLQREQGATLPELIEATGWLPHTTRAALTGLRKKGHVIDKSRRGDVTCYGVAAAA